MLDVTNGSFCDLTGTDRAVSCQTSTVRRYGCEILPKHALGMFCVETGRLVTGDTRVGLVLSYL